MKKKKEKLNEEKRLIIYNLIKIIGGETQNKEENGKNLVNTFNSFLLFVDSLVCV